MVGQICRKIGRHHQHLKFSQNFFGGTPTVASLALTAVFLFAASPRSDKGGSAPESSENKACAQRGKLAIFQEAHYSVSQSSEARETEQNLVNEGVSSRPKGEISGPYASSVSRQVAQCFCLPSPIGQG
jgi:hypothetical protein